MSMNDLYLVKKTYSAFKQKSEPPKYYNTDVISICTDKDIAKEHIDRAVKEYIYHLEERFIEYSISDEYEGWMVEIMESNGWLVTFGCEKFEANKYDYVY